MSIIIVLIPSTLQMAQSIKFYDNLWGKMTQVT
jgi:hypothetical protein